MVKMASNSSPGFTHRRRSPGHEGVDGRGHRLEADELRGLGRVDLSHRIAGDVPQRQPAPLVGHDELRLLADQLGVARVKGSLAQRPIELARRNRHGLAGRQLALVADRPRGHGKLNLLSRRRSDPGRVRYGWKPNEIGTSTSAVARTANATVSVVAFTLAL